MDGPTVEAEKYISITGKWLVSDVNVEVEGGAESPFQWIDAEQKVTFSASKGGTYNDALIISADDVAPQRVELSIKVIKPVIKIGAAELNFGEMSLADAVEGKQTQETTVSVQPEAEMTVELGGDNAAAFKAEIKDGKIIVAFKASAAGAYNAIATVKSAGAEPKNLMLSASVAMPKPELNVTPTEWKETISLSNGKAQAERQISINAVFTYSYPIVALQNGTNFTWDAANSKVTFSADKVGEYKDTLVVSAVGADDVKVALEITVKEEEIPVGPVAVTGVTLNQTSAEIEVGKTLTLVATVMPADADNKNVTWESSNATVATVANGVVTAVAVGAATITVKTVDGNYTATCVITVKDGGVTPPPTPAGGWVSDPSTLKAGDKIIITNMAHDKAMSTSQTAVENKSYYRGETA
ncbi:MAG: Ig domain-containing protein, partial [Ruminococcus sp.]|nr:Ig domain-containing protein [Ruminococcus sp.]